MSLLFFAEGPAAEKLFQEERNGLLKKIGAAEYAFRQTNKDRADRIDFRGIQGLPTHFSLSALSAVDLVVMQRPEPSQNPLLGPNIGDLIMLAGRPVLVVSADNADFRTDTILIAWKDTREARRAVVDSLPLLKSASKVLIITVTETVNAGSAAVPGGDLLTWLAHHGVSASFVQASDSGGAPEQIIDLATREGANLIVAGAYGRSRFSEWLFGGVTASLLENATFRFCFRIESRG